MMKKAIGVALFFSMLGASALANPSAPSIASGIGAGVAGRVFSPGPATQVFAPPARISPPERTPVHRMAPPSHDAQPDRRIAYHPRLETSYQPAGDRVRRHCPGPLNVSLPYDYLDLYCKSVHPSFWNYDGSL